MLVYALFFCSSLWPFRYYHVSRLWFKKKIKQKNFHIKLIPPSAIDPKMAAAAFKWLIAWWEGE